jgi:hypothetical protein
MTIISTAMCVLCVLAIGVAEAFMPDNVHGRQGVITFYRWFGASFAAWLGIGIWAITAYQSKRTHRPTSGCN